MAEERWHETTELRDRTSLGARAAYGRISRAARRSCLPADHLTPEEEHAVPTVTISPWPLTKKGKQGHPVRTLQHLLRAQGHSVAVDGIFGPATEAAVRAFQQKKGLAVDGIVGPQTWAAVIVQVKQGSRGDAVRGVQEEFQFRNLSGDPSQGVQIDGIFGPKTDAAVRGFQDALDLAVDGIVGPLTWRALVSGMLAG
jgi:peptidoglycan hydrolase-like protein with peptidoglycan-binding domain